MSERYKREIEDLLRKLDDQPVHEPVGRQVSRRTAGLRSGFQSAFRAFLRRQPIEQFMMAAIGFLLIAALLDIVGILPGVAYWANILAVMMFFLAVGLAFARHRRPGQLPERRWRGQPVDLRPPGQDFWSRVRLWFRGRR